MSDIDTLAARIRRQLAADERDALAGRGIFPRPGVEDSGAVCLHVKPGGNMAVTWYRNPVDGYKDMADLRNWADTENGWTRERVLAVVSRDRRLLDLLLAEPHAVDRDDWCDCDQLIDGPCTCGRDARVVAYLAVLAEAYEETT